MASHRHSATAYKNGQTDCPECRAAHTKAQAAYRKSRRASDAPQAPSVTLATVLALPGGPIEAAVDQELEFLESDPPFRQTLVALVRLNARVLDHIGELDRPDLLSSVQGRLMNALDRLSKDVPAAEKPEFDVAELLRPE